MNNRATRRTKIITIAIIFSGLVCFLLIIASQIIFVKHKPSYLHQARIAFKDNNNNAYFSTIFDLVGYNFSESDYNENSQLSEIVNISSKRIVEFDDYIALTAYDSKTKLSSIRVYNKNFELMLLDTFDESVAILDAVGRGDVLYYLQKELTNNSVSLFSLDIQTRSSSLLLTRVEHLTTYSGSDVKITFGELDAWGRRMAILGSTTPFLNVLINNELCKYCDGVVVSLNKKKITITYDNYSYEFKNNLALDVFYDKCYLIDNNVVFAAYKNKKTIWCGRYSNTAPCICSFGTSALFSFDLITKKLSVIKSYEPGTFLVDYDMSGSKYYYNGGLYVNDCFLHTCETIKPSQLQIIAGQNYYSPGKEQSDNYLSFLDDTFYGIDYL